MSNINTNVKSYFDTHKAINEFYFTDDQLAFYTQDNAIAHANNLKTKGVTLITRAEVDAWEAEQEVEAKMLDVEVTQDMLDENPDLAAQGVEVGEVIEVPVDNTQETAEEIKEDVKAAVKKKTAKKKPASKKATATKK